MFALIVPLTSIAFPVSKASAADTSKEFPDKPLIIDGITVPKTGQIEIEKARTTTTRTYLKSDGTKQLEIFDEPINYEKTIDGKQVLTPIDSTLTQTSTNKTTGKKIYTSKSTKENVTIGESLFEDGVSISNGTNKIGVKPVNAFAPAIATTPTLTSGMTNYLSPEKKSTVITDDSVSNLDRSGNIEYKYISTNKGLKEIIVLNEPTTQNVFYFDLDMAGMYAEFKDKSYYFYDLKTKKQVFYIPPSFATDANFITSVGEESVTYDVTTELIKVGAKSQIKLTVDKKWLSDKSRKYPVTIDPTINPTGGDSNDDTYAEQGSADTKTWDQANLYVGYEKTYGKKWTHTYLPFGAPSTLGNTAIIDNAKISLYQTVNIGNHGTLLRMVTDKAAKDITWNSEPTRSTEYIYNQDSNTSAWVNMDITALAQYWYQIGMKKTAFKPGYLFLQDDTEGDKTTDAHYRVFRAQNYDNEKKKPAMTINYHTINASYSISSLHDAKIYDSHQFKVTVNNLGQDSTWRKSNSAICIYTTNNSNGQKASTSYKIPYDMGSGSSATILVQSNANGYFENPGNYTVYADLYSGDYGYMSDYGVKEAQGSFNIGDYPAYSGQYSPANLIPSVQAGAPQDVYVAITNNSKTAWNAGSYSIGYHLVDNENGREVSYGSTPLTNDVLQPWTGRNVGGAKVTVKAPTKAGSYTIKWDLITPSGWYSAYGVGTSNQTLNVTSLPLASQAHFGVENYYPMVGPVDITTGNLVYSVTDATIPSVTGGLSIERTYNSNKRTYNANASGYVTSWLINGPYYENDKTTRFDASYINEATAKPSQGLVTNNRPWANFTADAGVNSVDLLRYYTGNAGFQMTDNVATYAATYVYSPETKTVLMKYGSDDGVKIWLNGQLVAANNVDRGVTLDSDVTNVTLNKGWNRVLVKVINGAGGHGFALRFTDASSAPITNLEYTTYNPDVYQGNYLFGKNWTASFDERLDLTDLSTVYYRNATGSVNVYFRNPDGTYAKPAGGMLNLFSNADGTYTLASQQGIKFIFDNAGKLQRRSDLFGNTIFYTYDAQGKCVKIYDKTIDGKGTQYLTISYDANSNIVAISNKLNQTLVSYQYTNGFLVKALDPASNFVSYQYLDDGRMQTNIDKKGQSKVIAYTQDGKVWKITGPDGVTQVSLGYGANGIVTISDSMNRNTILTYDPTTLTLSETADAKGNKDHYNYDGNFNLVRLSPVIPADSEFYYSYDYLYDKYDNLLSETDPLGNKSTYTYDANNNLIKAVDSNGNTSEATYNTQNLQLSAKDPKGNTTSATYDIYGHALTQTDANGNKDSYRYDAEGFLTATVSPKGEVTSYGFDNIGRKIYEKSPLGKSNNFVYDIMGRMSEIKDAGGLSTKIEYDKNNNIVKQTNPRGFSKLYDYDVYNRLLSSTDELGAKISYKYDAVGNNTKIIDVKGKEITYEYSELNQLTKITDARGKTSKIVYDVNGNVTSSTDFNLKQFNQSVNKNGDPTSVTSPDGSVAFKYDANGNVIETSSNANTISLAYDANNNITNTTSTTSASVATTYDKADNVTNIQSGDTNVSLNYDSNNSLASVSQTISSTGQKLTNNFVRDADGKLTKIVKANGDVTNFTFDASNRISTVKSVNSANTLLTSYSYTYDATSNITSISDRYSNRQYYTYDARNQLTKDNLAQYTYDLAGNRTKMQDGFNTVSYTYDEAGDGNRLLSANSTQSGATSYVYDDNGNVLERTDGQGKITKYSYDTDGYFIKAIMPDGKTVEYTYDKITKLRQTRTETSATNTITVTKFVWDGDRLISELDGSDKTLRTYTWGDDETLISISLPDANGVLQTYYYQKNAKGDIMGMTNQAGTPVASYEYDAWGNIKKSTTALTSSVKNIDKLNPRLYAGYWYDTTLGTYFMKVRLYDPTIGRFLSKDPLQRGIDPIDYNPYVYCANNPVSRLDPSGKSWFNSVKTFVSEHKQQIAIAVEITVAIGAAIAITAVTGGLGAGLGAAIIIGAVSGAMGAAAGYTVSNWGNLSWGGLGTAALTGAVSGAVGGALGYGAGKLLSAGAKAIGGAITNKAAGSAVAASGKQIGNAVFKSQTAAYRSATPPLGNTVYQAINKITNKVEYIGITNNIERRTTEQLASKGINIKPIKGLTNLSREDARLVEQRLIEEHGLGNLLNKINSISTKNPLYSSVSTRGTALLKAAGYSLK